LIGNLGIDVQGLAYNISDGYLYGANASNSTLYQIDSADGSKVLIANLGIDVRGLAYIPEPTTLLLLGLGGLALLRKRRP